MADTWHRNSNDDSAGDDRSREPCLARKLWRCETPSMRCPDSWSDAKHGKADEGQLGLAAGDLVAVQGPPQRLCRFQPETSTLIHAHTHALVVCRRLPRNTGTRISLKTQFRLPWVATVLALLNTFFAVAGQEAYWSNAVPMQVTVGHRVNISLTGSGFLVGASDYSCLFRTEVVNQFVGEYEVRRSPLEIITGHSAQCTSPDWDLPAMTTTFQIVKNDEFVPAEVPSAFRFLHAIHSMEPSAGPASGAQTITFNGTGFGNLPGARYSSIFSGSGGVQVTSEPCSVDDSTRLICETPKWPSLAGLASVTVLNNAERLSGTFRRPFLLLGFLSSLTPTLTLLCCTCTAGAHLSYRFVQSCTTLSPTSSYAAEATNVSISGQGFQAGELVTCRFNQSAFMSNSSIAEVFHLL